MLEFAWCHVMVNRHGFAEAVKRAAAWAVEHPVDASGAARLLMLEPYPHPGLADRIDHVGRGQLGRVILYVQSLPDDVD